jgi:hypothetical protein
MLLFQKVLRSLRRRGVWGTLKHSVLRIVRPFSPVVKQTNLEWDRIHGVETAVPLLQADFGVRDTDYACHYEAMDADQFQSNWSALGIRPDDYAFVDLGSGKGKVLLLASALPFRRIIGVEFSPLLHETAVRNIQAYRGEMRRVPEPICLDARDFRFPEGPLVVFLYNPFQYEVLSVVMGNLERSLRDDPRPAHVIYWCPMEAQALGPFWSRSVGPGSLILRPAMG